MFGVSGLGKEGNRLSGDYLGITFPNSLLRSSKLSLRISSRKLSIGSASENPKLRV